MNTFVTLRDQTAFPSYRQSSTSSESSSRSEASDYGSYTFAATISNGVSSTEISQEAYQTVAHEDTSASSSFSSSYTEDGGTTYYADATLTSVSQSQFFSTWYSATREGDTSISTSTNSSSTGFFLSSTASQSYTFFTQQATDYTYNRVITSNLPFTTTHYIVSGSGVLTTDTEAVTLLSTTTDEGGATSWANVATSSEFGTYQDIGAIYSADTDWFWVVQNTNLTPQFLTDIALSTDALTIFPVAVTLPQNVLSVDDSGAFTAAFSIDAATTSLTYQVLVSITTDISTYPSGDSISFIPATTSIPVWTTDTASTIFGNDSALVTGVSTSSFALGTWIADTYNATVTYPYGLNTSTTELVQLTSFFATTTAYNIVGGYLVSSSDSSSDTNGEEGYSEMGQTQEGADISYLGYNVIAWGGGAQAICPIAPQNAFVAPSDLRSENNPYNFADNLIFGTTRIPYGSLASVVTNAATPCPVAFTTTGTDAHSFSYSWFRDTLRYTEWITYTAGTSTVTDRTQSSGVFDSSSPMDAYYADGGTVYGGFPAIPTAADSVYFTPRAVMGTSISTNGASTTYRNLVTDTDYSEISETAIVEQSVPAFIAYTALVGIPAGGQLLVYPRNP